MTKRNPTITFEELVKFISYTLCEHGYRIAGAGVFDGMTNLEAVAQEFAELLEMNGAPKFDREEFLRESVVSLDPVESKKEQVRRLAERGYCTHEAAVEAVEAVFAEQQRRIARGRFRIVESTEGE